MCNCQRCERDISEFTLLGNALVIVPGAVEILCSRCRTGTDYPLSLDHPFNALPHKRANDTIDRSTLVGEIAAITHGTGGTPFTVYEAVLCLRQGLGLFQRSSRRPFAGFDATTLADAKQRFGTPLPGSCAECGALWANKWAFNRNPTLLESSKYSPGRCWACRFPTTQQWFMRTTLDTEMGLLLSP